MKVSAMLAKAEHTGKQFTALLAEYLKTFAHKENIFKGLKKEYFAEPNQEDKPQNRGMINVQSTVWGYLTYFEETTADYIDSRFSIEATNATGPKAELIVAGKSMGKYSAIELMRLKDLLNNADLFKMYQTLPVRSDTTDWVLSSNKEWAEKNIWETDVRKGLDRTTIKGSRILPDPNLVHLKGGQNYIPQVVPDDTTLLLGTQTEQHFSGQMSHEQRAAILGRITLLKAAVAQALVEANAAEVVSSQMTSKKLFGYIHHGTI